MALLSILIILGVVCSWLYFQNKRYESVNRQLILQNDSLLSVNLEAVSNRVTHHKEQ